MEQFSSVFVITRLLILLNSATVIVSEDQGDFSETFRHVVENILGIKDFETYLGQLRSDFVSQAPNGQIFTKLFAEDISREVTKRADAVRRNKNAIVDSLIEREVQSQPKCCLLEAREPHNFTVHPRFPGKTIQTLCHVGVDPAKPAKPTGISDRTVNAMKKNLKLIPSLKWQYFGNEHGTLYVYPGFTGCDKQTYDPRFREWYFLTATYPKDMVIMIDKSRSMNNQFGDSTRMHFGITATKAVIASLNPNDNIGVIAFADDVQYPKDACYQQRLALVTSANKEQLSDFVERINPSSEFQANYSNAFAEAFRLLAATDNSTDSNTNMTESDSRRAKVIILLTAGVQSESLQVINQIMNTGKQQVGQLVHILAFGLKTDDQSRSFLKNISGGSFTALDDADEQTIRERIGHYYNFFNRPPTDNNVVFSVPYNDTGGLGMVTSECLPVFITGAFRGVTCIDIPLDTLFSPIIDFRLAQLSYAFLIDSRGRVLLHPLLPKLETYKEKPIFLDMESVEISSETPAIKRSMISGVAGKMSIAKLLISRRRGDSPLEGVGFETQTATYFWDPISIMNASVAVVIVGNEKNNSLSWTTDFPPVLLTDELAVNDDQTNDKCNNFGRVAIRDRSAVKLSLQSVMNPYFYKEHADFDTGPLKSYLQGETNIQLIQGSLLLKPGVRESIAMTYKLERIWKRGATVAWNRSVDVDQLDNFALYRYVGTREGVYRVYPAIRVATKFDPTKQPWYRRAEAQKDRITLSTQAGVNGTVVTSLAKAFTDSRGNDILGVVGADVPFASIYDFLMTEFDPCRLPNTQCFAIDKSGFVVAHRDFLDSPPLSSQVHVTTKEPQVAADMLQRGVMTTDSCVNYADITNQRFYVVELHDGDRPLTDGHVYAISGLDMNVVIKYQQSTSPNATCSCRRRSGDSAERVRCVAGHQCQCPCYRSTDYSYCDGHFTISNVKTCYPPTLPIYLVDLSVEERPVVNSMAACQRCSLIAHEKLCVTTGCCWKSGICSTCSFTTTTTSSTATTTEAIPPTSDTDFSAAETSPPPTLCDSWCVGLAVGMSVGVVLLVAIVVITVVACRRRRLLAGHESRTSTAAAPHRTVVKVDADGGYSVDGYSMVEKTVDPSEEDQYLHL